jgi:hypothetical protein
LENGIDIEALKNDKEFLENLELLEKEMKEQNSIAKGYQLLNAKILLNEQDPKIDEIFTFIVEKAFDRLAEHFAKTEEFKISNEEDVATLRAIYEFAMQKWSEGDTKSASELFLALHLLTDDKELSDAFLVHFGAVQSGYSFEDFIEKLAVVPEAQLTDDSSKAYFIINFSQPLDIMLKMFEKEIKKGIETLKSLEK